MHLEVSSEDILTFMLSGIAGIESCAHEELLLEVVSVIPEKENLTDLSRTVSVCRMKPSM